MSVRAEVRVTPVKRAQPPFLTATGFFALPEGYGAPLCALAYGLAAPFQNRTLMSLALAARPYLEQNFNVTAVCG